MNSAHVVSKPGKPAIHGEFVPSEFASGFIGRCGWFIFHWRLPILLAGIVITLVLGFFAIRLQVTAGFSKMVPLNHEFMRTFRDYQSEFGGANNVLVAVKVKQGDIFDKEVLQTVKQITDDVFYIKGVERSSLLSISTPNARYNEVVEEGFKSGNLMPGDFAGRPEQIAQVRENVMKSDLIGRIVSADMTATMVVATLQERDPDTALATEPEEERAHRDLAETDDAAQGMDGDAQAGLVLDPHQDGVSLLGEIGALGSDVERIQVMLHGEVTPHFRPDGEGNRDTARPSCPGRRAGRPRAASSGCTSAPAGRSA